MSDLESLLDDLAAEGDAVRTAVADLPDDATGWRRGTPAEGWTIATQIAHLLWTDETSVLAATSDTPAGKDAWDAVVLAAIADPEGFVDTEALRIGGLTAVELLARWDAARTGLATALRAVPNGVKLPWFGPPMSPMSMATARFMETWAHAQDVYDALGLAPAPTDRIKHVAHIGVRTRNFAFSVHDLPAPSEEFYIELTAPSGATWTWGPADAGQRVTGSAVDFARLATQRVHRADTDLVAVGSDADAWLDIAQCFAGPAGSGREKN